VSNARKLCVVAVLVARSLRAKAIREGRNLDGIVIEILEAGAK